MVRQWDRLLALTVLSCGAVQASAIFNAPQGCQSIQPQPLTTGVQCFGEFVSDPGKSGATASFIGTGSGVLWTDSVLVEWSFSTSSQINRGVGVSAMVNGAGDFEIGLFAGASTSQHSGSFTLPVTYGAALQSWSFLVTVSSATSDTPSLSIPSSGIGLRMLAGQNPPPGFAAVPEPASITLLPAGIGLFVIARRLGNRARDSRP